MLVDHLSHRLGKRTANVLSLALCTIDKKISCDINVALPQLGSRGQYTPKNELQDVS